MKIFYGTSNNSIDVTHICLSKLANNNIITIPSGDTNRTRYFTDPLVGISKKIIISLNGALIEFGELVAVKINTETNTVFTDDINEKLKIIHSKLRIKYGTFDDELNEQKMALRYLTGKEKVLELGGNIGRNSLVISSILEDSANLVTLECDNDICDKLKENRDLNNLHFNIENSALSNRKIIQKQWETLPYDVYQKEMYVKKNIPNYNKMSLDEIKSKYNIDFDTPVYDSNKQPYSDNLPIYGLTEGSTLTKTITLHELKTKYNIEFDTLVLDCEGAFYFILMDMPEILNNIKLLIMENDYNDIRKKKYIEEVLRKNNFAVDYSEPGEWGPCADSFYEVWKKLDYV